MSQFAGMLAVVGQFESIEELFLGGSKQMLGHNQDEGEKVCS